MKIRVLFLASNPSNVTQLDLQREVEEIREKIDGSEFGDQIEIVPHWQPTTDGLIQLFNEDDRWHIIHFSGHGSEANELAVVDEDGTYKLLSKEALHRLFGIFGQRARLVVLNACFSEGQAELITEHVDCAVGMSRAVEDSAAIFFAASLYRAIGFGASIQDAFEQGKLAVDMEGLEGVDIPQIKTRNGFDADSLRFVTSVPAPKVQDEFYELAPPPPDLGDGQKWHVFLSYRSINRTWVLNLHDVLQRQGYVPFLDQFAITAGTALEARLQEGMEKSRTGVLIWSGENADSEWCMKEFRTLVERRERDPSFRFVTLRLGGELPEEVAGDVYLDFSGQPDGPNGGGLLRLLFALADESLSAEAAHFANQLDEDSRAADTAIKTAVLNGNVERLVGLFRPDEAVWNSSATLGGKVAEALTKLKKYDDALAILDKIQERFPRAIRPKQMRGLAYARRGGQGDLEKAQTTLGALYAEEHRDPETVGMYARTWMDRYAKSNNKGHLKRSRNLYAEAFEITPGDTYTGINAAAKSVFLGEADVGREYAKQVLDILSERTPSDYWEEVTVGEAHLILGEYIAAADAYGEAVIRAFEEKGSHESTLQQASRLKEAIGIPEESWQPIAEAFDTG